jgi:hypothetical protein
MAKGRYGYSGPCSFFSAGWLFQGSRFWNAMKVKQRLPQEMETVGKLGLMQLQKIASKEGVS